MAGSWELQSNQSVLTAFLHIETTTVAWAMGFKALHTPGPIFPITARPYDHARNEACMRALEAGVDYLFFIDSDVIAPPDTILRLMAHRKPIISGVYHRRSPPVGVPVMQRGGNWVSHYPANQIIEVDVVGAGCLLIHRDVLKQFKPQRIGKHWFDWRVDLAGNDACPMSEDFTFCHAARAQGWPVLVDTGIQCKHIGLAEATYNYLGACVA